MTSYTNYAGECPPPIYPRLPSAPPEERKGAPPRPVYPPGGSPRYPPPGMHRPGPATGAVAVLPTAYNQQPDGRPELPPKPSPPKQEVIIQTVPPKVIVIQRERSRERSLPKDKSKSKDKSKEKSKEKSKITDKSKDRGNSSSSDSEGIEQKSPTPQPSPRVLPASPMAPQTPQTVITPQTPQTVIQPETQQQTGSDDPKVKKLRMRNYIFMALAGVSFLLCLNVIFGAIALVFAILAEMDLGHGKIKSGSSKSIVSIVLTIVGVFIAVILVTVFFVIHT